jgi:hypothetical protein
MSTLGAIASVVVVAFLWPNESEIPDSVAFYDALTPVARSQIANASSGTGEGVRMPNGHVIYLKPEVVASRKTEVLSQYEAAVVKEVHAKRLQLVAAVCGACLAGSLSLLVCGHLVAWVVRGFRGNQGV